MYVTSDKCRIFDCANCGIVALSMEPSGIEDDYFFVSVVLYWLRRLNRKTK